VDREQIHVLAGLIGSPYEDRKHDVVIRCPMAPLTHKNGTDTHPAMSIKVDTVQASVAMCFACGTSGRLSRIFRDAQEGIGGLDDALAFIAENDKGGLAGAFAALRVRRERGATAAEDSLWFDIDAYIGRCARQVHPYVVERGLVREDITRWRIGYDPDLYRIVFPVWDCTGALVGAGRRSILPEEDPRSQPRYYDTPGLPKDATFYGEHRLDPTREHAFIVEGYMDTIYASRVLPNVLGFMGANTGKRLDEQPRMRKLRRWCRSVTLIFDGDQAGRDAVYGREDHKGRWLPGLRDALRTYMPVKVALLPEDQDPASVPAATLLEAVKNAAYLGT
jgi:hypothetical protein